MKLVAHSEDQTPADDAGELAGLLAAASAGQESAWREIVDRFGRRVFALAKSRCRNVDVAEEITQSVFATIAAKLAQGLYVEQGRFESWLFRITMNRVRDEGRRTKRQATSDAGDALERAPDHRMEQRPGGDAGESVEALRRAMSSLSESDREIVELRHHGGMSFKQMSDLLHEPLGTLLARHHRALRKLKEILEESFADREDTRGGAS